MNLKQLETVVLCGVNVVRDVVTVLPRKGSNQAIAGFPATLSSHRHPSSWLPADADSWLRDERPAKAGANRGAPRAGRLGSLAGTFMRRWRMLATARPVLSRKQAGCLRGSMRPFAGAMRRS
jgi:hypothetical protein